MNTPNTPTPQKSAPAAFLLTLATLGVTGCATEPTPESSPHASQIEAAIEQSPGTFQLDWVSVDGDPSLLEPVPCSTVAPVLRVQVVETWADTQVHRSLPHCLVPTEGLSFEDLVYALTSGAYLFASGTYSSVSPGSKVSFTVDIPMDWKFDTEFNVYGYNASTGDPIKDTKARMDVFRDNGSWQWRAKAFPTSGSGLMVGGTWCGSKCDRVRAKLTNKATSATHAYVMYLFLY